MEKMARKSLIIHENSYLAGIRNIELVNNAGDLLPAIPNHAEWEDFLASVKAEWRTWRRDLGQYPSCLIVLYGGLAFYEYEDNTLWPQFSKAVGTELLSANQQREINAALSEAAQYLGLKILQRKSGKDYVGSAVYYIGIPLSLWDGFLEICEWALWREDWKNLRDEEWAESVEKRAGGRVRLKRFLIENREAATGFIQVMLDAREILSKDVNLTIDKIVRGKLLRVEYFDEVPGTAEFLRPQNPESLFQDRARLTWNDQQSYISLNLPSIATDKLPAIWSIGELTQKAASTPDDLILNSAAFHSSLILKLESGQKSEIQRLQGLKPWGLFDLERGRFINQKRERLPLGSYDLISSVKFDKITRKGFDETEFPVNESYELKDGKKCFVTRLRPTDKHGMLSLTQGEESWELSFSPGTRIEACFFMGEGSNAAKFSYADGLIKIEQLPLLCIAIPLGYFKNIESILVNKFQIFVDEMPGRGKWEKRHADDDREFYIWRWEVDPVKKVIKTRKLKNFKELNIDDFKPPNLLGKRTISINSAELGVKFEYQIEVIKSNILNLDKYWQKLPGAFLLFFLLDQRNEGMKWNDLILAKEVIAPSLKISYQLLYKYASFGLIRQRGQVWQIAEARAVISATGDECLIKYCGSPSLLWGLIKTIFGSTDIKQQRDIKQQSERIPKRIYIRDAKSSRIPLSTTIDVEDKRGELPFLIIRCQAIHKNKIENYFKVHGVRIVSDLWRC